MALGARVRGACAAVAVVVFLGAVGAAAPARAVITFDLLQDTPRTREMLRDELSTTALAPGAPAAAEPFAAREELEGIWFSRERYLQIGESEKARQQLQLLWERAAVRGIRNLPAYAAVLVREARRRMEVRDFEEAARALGDTRRIAPDQTSVYLAGAQLALRRSPLNLVPAWEQLAEAVRSVPRSFRAQVRVAGTALAAAMASLALFFTVSVGVLFLQSAPRIAHDVREALPAGGPRVRGALSWAVLASPALIGLSPWWWPFLAGLVLWPYADLRGRGLLAAGAVFVLALPVFFRVETGLLALPGQPLLAAVVQVREGHWTEGDYQELRTQAEAGAAGVPGVTALGIAARRLGHLEESERASRAGLEAAPTDPALWNNLGNVAYARGDIPGAIEAYTKATKFGPGLFAPHYNLGLAYRESFKFVEGEAESRRASDIDAEAVAYYAGLDPSRVKAYTIDEPPRSADLWSLARRDAEGRPAAAEGLWSSLMLGPSLHAWPLVAAALLALSGVLGTLRLRRGTARQCPRCGRTSCQRCQGGRASALCSQCHHIFVKKEGVDASVRVRKMGEIKTHRLVRRVRHLVLAALVPGAGQLSAGRFWAGVLLLAPAAVLESRLLLGAGTFPDPWGVDLAGGAGVVAGWVLLGALWIAGLALAWRVEE